MTLRGGDLPQCAKLSLAHMLTCSLALCLVPYEIRSFWEQRLSFRQRLFALALICISVSYVASKRTVLLASVSACVCVRVLYGAWLATKRQRVNVASLVKSVNNVTCLLFQPFYTFATVLIKQFSKCSALTHTHIKINKMPTIMHTLCAKRNTKKKWQPI